MENWTNLNKMLSINRRDEDRNREFTQKIIEFCTHGQKKEVVSLLMEGANLNCYEEALTPLIVCIDNDHYELAQYLLKVGASISYRPTKESTDAFWHALINKKHAFLELFVENRCLLERNLIDKQSTTETTALIYAVGQSDVKAVEILLNHFQIKINERDGNGDTALNHNLAKTNMSQEDMRIGQLLIAAGADTVGTNLDKKTPEEVAADFAAKSMLLASKLERDLPQPKEPEPVMEDDDTYQPPNPSKKFKI